MLGKHSVKLKKIDIKNLKVGKGISKWNEETFDKEVQKCVRVWPHHNDTDGFFLARIEKC